MEFIKRGIRELIGWMSSGSESSATADHLQTSTDFRYIGQPGREVEDIFEGVAPVPGWFNLDDCSHFLLVLRLQTLLGVRGDLFEIGSYHGRSSAVMASALADGESLVVCDAFQKQTEDPYSDRPTVSDLIRNIQRLVPDISEKNLIIHDCLSQDISLADDRKFRFVHIDGGHSETRAYSDLCLAADHLVSHGIIVMDDYGNPNWPGVTEGTDRFLDEYPDHRPLADLNRHGASGRKLYIARVRKSAESPFTSPSIEGDGP